MTVDKPPIPANPEESVETSRPLPEIGTRRGRTAGKVKSALIQKRSQEEIDAIFKDPSHVFLVVEDDECGKIIVSQLNERRQEKNSRNVYLAGTVTEAKETIERILRKSDVTRITLVLDWNFPFDRGNDSPYPNAGWTVLVNLRRNIERYNSSRPKKPITLEVFMNSTEVTSQERVAELGAVGFCREKDAVMKTLETHFMNGAA